MSRHAPRPIAAAIDQTLAAQLVMLAAEVERLEAKNAELLEQQLNAPWDLERAYEEAIDEAYAVIADHKRGLISTDELYERTVGR